MAPGLSTVDIVVVVSYFLLIIGIGIYASCKVTKGSVKSYFLAGRDINFFMIGASLFVSNIGAEHFMGLAGSGAAGGIGVGAWEFIAIFGLQVLGFIFLPVYLACQTRTMPEYLHKRFGGERIRIYYAVLSLLHYVLTKCSVGLFTGAVYMQQSLGLNLYICTAILIVIVAVLTLAGGLTAVIYTDTVQFIVMLVGASVITSIGFREVGGLQGLWEKYPHSVANESISNGTCIGGIHRQWDVMLRDIDDPNLPWLGFLLGGLPGITWYLCADQVMVQRALAARSLSHGQGAVIMTSLFKILPFFIMVFPGMISRVLFPDEIACAHPDYCYAVCENRAGCSNIAFPKLVLEILPDGLRGLMMSVLIAAVMSDLDSFFNSASTIFAVDIWKRIRRNATVREQMVVGRIFLILIAGLSLAWVPVLKELNSGQVFLYITEVANHLAAPSAAIFLLAVLWPRATEKGAFTGLVAGLIVGILRLALAWSFQTPSTCSNEEDTRPVIVKDVPYLYVTAIQFIVALKCCIIVSLCSKPPEYKMLYRTTIWSKTDDFNRTEVESGLIAVKWSQCSYYISEESNVSLKTIKAKADTYLDDIQPDIEPTHPYAQEETSGTKSLKKHLLSWFCPSSSENIKSNEEFECSMEQPRSIRILLLTLSFLCLIICVSLLGFWTMWKHNTQSTTSIQ